MSIPGTQPGSTAPRLPPAPKAIQKGTPVKNVLNAQAVHYLAQNIALVHAGFDAPAFAEAALDGLEPLSLMQRGQHVAKALRHFLPGTYSEALDILVACMTPMHTEAGDFSLAELFYLPHSFFISEYGLAPQHNNGADPFEASMRGLQELTTRFTAEFAIRPFLIQQQERTLAQVATWLGHPNPHIRRLCSEGTRPRLPWGKRIPAFIADPQPALFILEALKDDGSLYVRRSVANHLGDIAKDHPDLAFALCERWLHEGASAERKWLIRHAVRHPAKKGNQRALAIRVAAKR